MPPRALRHGADILVDLLLGAASIGEALFGIILAAVPALAFDLYFGSQPDASGIIMTRVADIALVGFGIACYPRGGRQGFVGMLAFSVLITVYLIMTGIGGSAGILLWPGVAVHALLSMALIIFARLEKTA